MDDGFFLEQKVAIEIGSDEVVVGRLHHAEMLLMMFHREVAETRRRASQLRLDAETFSEHHMLGHAQDARMRAYMAERMAEIIRPGDMFWGLAHEQFRGLEKLKGVKILDDLTVVCKFSSFTEGDEHESRKIRRVCGRTLSKFLESPCI